MPTADEFTQRGREALAGHLGIAVMRVEGAQAQLEMPVQRRVGAPDGHVHAGAVIALATEAAATGCLAALPPGATGFAMIELKANHLSSPHDGWLDATARGVHLGRTLQVWDVEVVHRDTAKPVALIRCTQMVMYPR